MKRSQMLTLLFGLTVGAAAFQLFLLEATVGKQLLPVAGGGPKIWNTCLVFYQVALLVSYFSAFLLSKFVRPTLQVLLVAALLVTALSTPTFLNQGIVSAPTFGESVEGWLWLWLLGAVAIPFCAVAVLSPILQHWFSILVPDREPYPLYAASNLGSFLGILAYPSMIERLLTLTEQRSLLWVALLGVLLPVAGLGAGLLGRKKLGCTREKLGCTSPAARGDGAKWSRIRQILSWVVLAALPSSLLLSVTNYILTDISPLPLFWMLPLLLYLGSFIVAFRWLDATPVAALGRAAAFLGVPIIVAFALDANTPALLLIPLHLLAFGVTALFCHGVLAQMRPRNPSALTEYYLWLSLGGAVGGLVTTLLCPLLFVRYLEYPLAIVLVALVRAVVVTPGSDEERTLPAGEALWKGASVVALVVLGWQLGKHLPQLSDSARHLLLVAPAALLVVHDIARPRIFAVTLAALALVSLNQLSALGNTLHAVRNFFGVIRVTEREGVHHIIHGSTIHGMQLVSEVSGCHPTSYYHPTGPAGELFALTTPAPQSVAVVGLGVGSLICYARPQDRWRFYELNPAMVTVAQNPNLFTYLKNSPTSQLSIAVGDGRQLLAAEPYATFDRIVVDAFSSDAIPTHLLTEEAFRMMLDRLRPGGSILVHISNRYFDLRPVLGALAGQLPVVVFIRADRAISNLESAQGKMPSIWAVVLSQGARAPGPEWRPAPPSATRPWSDEFSDPVSVLRLWEP